MAGEPSNLVYLEPGGDTLVVKGKDGGVIKGQTAAGATPAQAAAKSDLTITYTAANPSITANGAVTVANGGTPTVAELLEFCEELKSQTNTILAALRGAGIMAT